jgi:hypothetical protein
MLALIGTVNKTSSSLETASLNISQQRLMSTFSCDHYCYLCKVVLLPPNIVNVAVT